MSDDGKFASRLRAAREHVGITQYELARRAGLSRQAISSLELGDREPTWHTVQLLAKAMGVDCRSFADPKLVPPDVDPPKPRGRPKSSGGKPAAGGPGGRKKGE